MLNLSEYGIRYAAGQRSKAGDRRICTVCGSSAQEGRSCYIKVLKTGWGIFTTLLLIAAAVLVALFALPRLFGMQLYVVTSGSMEPKYPVGSLLYVQEVEPEDLKVGDAITFLMEDSDSAATHEIREIDAENGQVYTQGINNRDEEGNILPDAAPVPYDSILGRPEICLPGLGRINQFCTTSPGIFILLGALVTVIGVTVIIECLTPEEQEAKSPKRKRKRRRKH